jgi:hypothetical protein
MVSPSIDSDSAGLVMMARLHGIAADLDQLSHPYRETSYSLW